MIKKIGLLIIICVLIYGTYNVYKNGLTLGSSVNAISYQKVKEKSAELNNQIDKLENLNNTYDKTELKNLEAARSSFNLAKNTYEKLAASASADEIAEANKREEYLLDYLWIKIGNYANANNIKVLINPTPGVPVLNFDVSGPYISVINFIYDLENDDELRFNVDNIIMQGTANLSDTKATFTVSGVNIVTSES